MIIFMLQKYRGKKIMLAKRINIMPVVVAFLILAIVCVIEYIGHYAVETFAGAKPWDYSDKFMNVNGRICLEDSMRFVVLGMIGIYALVPIAEKLFGKLTGRQNTIVSIVLAAAMVVDVVVWTVLNVIVKWCMTWV